MSDKIVLLLRLFMVLRLSNASLEGLEIQMHVKLNKMESIWEERFRKLEQIVSRQEVEIHKLQDKLFIVKLSDDEKGRQIAGLKAYISNKFLQFSTRERDDISQGDVEVSVKRQSEVRAAQETTAFYAYMSTRELNPSPHHIFIFDHAVTNVNGGYSPFTGIFTAPFNGVYGFTFSIRTECHGYGSYELIKNADVQGTVFGNFKSICTVDYLGGTFVISANKGDKVFVRTHSTLEHAGDITSDTNGRTWFAGWLI